MIQTTLRWTIFAAMFAQPLLTAGTIVIGGTITQSTPDGTGPAVKNPSLNNILDGDAFLLTLVVPGPTLAPGMYTAASLTFSDPVASSFETAFSGITLTVTLDAGNDEFSLLGCLLSGDGCAVGNQLDADFEIPSALINSQNVSATGLDQPHPLDLLEDDGSTDIQGSITTYSAVPEPSTAFPITFGLLALLAKKSKIDRKTK